MSYDALKALEGTEVGVTDWMEITQERVDRFAAATDDHQWIHVDPERAASGPFGGTIAHGFLTLSLVVPLGSQVELPVDGVKMALNYGLDRVRFTNPVRVGSRIRLRREVLEVTRAKDGGVQVKNGMTIEVEGEERPAAVAETLARIYF
ncbi:MAG: MaoC family dehydratase [Acidimicrobiia bacterium]|nr:MaoC family dehydratase [Acidimicrobiia bacterium]